MSTNSFQLHNKHNQSSSVKAFHSSSETILVDDETNNESDNIHLNHDDQKSIATANSGKNKSLKINVMRDLKSAQKLKSAFTNSKFSKNFSSISDSAPLTFFKTSAGSVKPSSSFMDDTYQQSQSRQNSQAEHKETFSNVRRSQTFSVSANNFNKSRSNTTSILPLPNNSDSTLHDSDFNPADNLSPTNSQSSFYNDSRMCNNFSQQGIYKNGKLDLCVYLESSMNGL